MYGTGISKELGTRELVAVFINPTIEMEVLSLMTPIVEHRLGKVGPEGIVPRAVSPSENKWVH